MMNKALQGAIEMTITTQKRPSTIEKSANGARRGEILESPGVTLRGLAQKVVENDKGLKYVF